MSGLERHEVPDDVDGDEWRLRITGAVERSVELSERDLEAYAMETFTSDFDCIAGWTAAGLSWRGVRVGTLLDRATPTADCRYALVRAADGEYACSFPLDRLRSAVLAVELDGERLPLEHGGPARLVPTATDADCWESIKWVEGIELHRSEPAASDTAKATALSRIDAQ